MTTLQTVTAEQANKETPFGENFETLSAAAIYGRRQPAESGLTWGYYGGLYNGNTIANGTVTLTDSADNYVVVLRSSGVVSASTSSANSTNPLYAKLYKVTCAGGVATVVLDQRWDTNGLFYSSPAGTASPAFSATPTIDTSAAEVIYFGALTANVTAFNLSGTRAKVIVAFVQDGTGSRTVTAGTSIDFGTDIPDLTGIRATASTYTYVGFVYHPTTAKFRVVAISK